MKYKIKKITEKKFGKTYKIWYDVMGFERNWNGIFFGVIIPIVGWLYLFISNPFEKKWRTICSFDKYNQALYYINNDWVFETKEEFVK